MEINTDDFTERGLYLLLPEGRRIALTQARVETFAHAFESNLDRIPPEIHDAVHFQFCPVCPEKGRSPFCHALPPTLAFFADLKDFNSHDRVGAVYRGPEAGLVCVPETTMQEALQYVVILSLLEYCEVGLKYGRFFQGTHPLMSSRELITRVHLNIHWDCQGDGPRIKALLRAFTEEITCTCRCQIQRLRLICEHDALINAFVNLQTQIEFMHLSRGPLHG